MYLISCKIGKECESSYTQNACGWRNDDMKNGGKSDKF